MRRLILICSFLAFPLPSLAEIGFVRAGEHATFSRLVIEIPEGSKWSLSKDGDSYIAQVPGVSEFDTSQVFSRIPTNRIADAFSEYGAGKLGISINCECYASAFLWRPDKLVVDIIDGLAPDGLQLEAASPSPKNATILPIIVSRGQERKQSESLPSPLRESFSMPQEKAALTALERLVVEGLARGATQGLLRPSEHLEPTGDTSNAAFFGQISAHFEQNQPGLMAHTSIEMGRAGLGEGKATTIGACLPDNYFAMEAWGRESGLFDTIAPLRANLTGELYEVSHESINQLAKGYLFFGFGREARETLRLDQEMSQERKVLDAIGAIIDGDPADSEILAHQVDCEGETALWAFLGSDNVSVKAKNPNAILRAFRNLPTHLQSHLAPRLSVRFIDVGDFGSAETAMSIDTYIANDTIEASLAKSDLQAEIGEPRSADEELVHLIATDVRMTPEGLINYFEEAAKDGAAISGEALALADILRFEYSGKAVAARLAAAQVDALLSVHLAEQAIAILTEEKSAIEPVELKRLMTAAIVEASLTYADSQFLSLAFSSKVDQVEPRAQNALAERLLGFDLPERAAQLLVGPAIGEDMSERRYLRATAAIELGDPSSAIQSIAGMTTATAIELRQRAGNFDTEEFAHVESAIGNDWRLGNWAALSQGTDELLQSVSLAVLKDEPFDESPVAPLARSRELLEDSRQTRLLMESVLTRFEGLPE